MSGKDIPVGIDLGTTNSLIGAVVEGKARLFADASGNELLPSVVGGGPSGELYIGRAGKNRRLLDPEGTVVSVKRRMGTDVRLKMGTKELSPPQVSALILGALLDRAEAALGARPTRAVITVPAYFGDAQRQATRDAGEMAGLRVERLVNEPTAAALTYQTGAEELVMVYDLGGGTFDVSVLERDEGLLEVRASRGDTHLGGDDIDRALAELVLRRLGAARAAVERDPRALTRIYEAVERAKIALSDREEIRLFDPFLTGEGEAVHLDLALTRADVEEAARPFVIRTLTHVDAALHDAGVKPGDVHRVLLVGGSSKMPLVRRMAAAHLGRPVHVDLDADRAVALGASLLAGRLGGAEVDEVLVDITPHTLAVGVLDVGALDQEGIVDLAAAAVIPRDTVVPVERTRTVFTVVPDQVAADLPIVQGEHPRLAGNTPLGKVRVEPLPPGPALSPVEVTFKLDLSGVLHVRAVHVRSGRVAEAHITESPYGLTEQHRRRAGVEVEQIRAAAPEAAAGPSDHDLSLARALVGRAAKALEKEGGDEAGRARVEAAAEALEEAIAARSAEVMDRGDALADALLDLI